MLNDLYTLKVQLRFRNGPDIPHHFGNERFQVEDLLLPLAHPQFLVASAGTVDAANDLHSTQPSGRSRA